MNVILDNVIYGVAGAWNAVINLITQIFDAFSSNSPDSKNPAAGYGVNRDALAEKFWGECAKSEDFKLYGGMMCDNVDTNADLSNDKDFASSKPGEGRILSSDHLGSKDSKQERTPFSSSFKKED